MKMDGSIGSHNNDKNSFSMFQINTSSDSANNPAALCISHASNEQCYSGSSAHSVSTISRSLHK